MKKAIGSLLVTVLGLALLVYSAMRSLDFISLTLPPDRVILAYFGLAALDGGLVFWLLNFLYGARGGWQRAIAILMVIIDFVGAVTMFTLDTLYNTGKTGMTAAMGPDEIQTALLALSAIIAINIGATVAHHIVDPDNRQRMAREEAEGEIEDQAIRLLNESVPALAADLSPIMATDVLTGLRDQYTGLSTGRSGRVKAGRAKITGNVYASETASSLPEIATTPEANPTPRPRSK
jgi:hypothetical protein